MAGPGAATCGLSRANDKGLSTYVLAMLTLEWESGKGEGRE